MSLVLLHMTHQYMLLWKIIVYNNLNVIIFSNFWWNKGCVGPRGNNIKGVIWCAKKEHYFVYCNVFMWFKVQKTHYFSTYCTLLLLLYAPPSETHRFLQSSLFWEARCALIGQLSSALWLAEYFKRVTEMLPPYRIVMPCPGATRQKQ